MRSKSKCWSWSVLRGRLQSYYLSKWPMAQSYQHEISMFTLNRLQYDVSWTPQISEYVNSVFTLWPSSSKQGNPSLIRWVQGISKTDCHCSVVLLRKMFWVWFLSSSLVMSFPSCVFMLLVFFAGFTKHGTLLGSREPHQTLGDLPEVGQPADEGVLPPRRHGAGEKAGY